MKKILFSLLVMSLLGNNLFAQRSYVRQAVEKDMEKKYADDKKKGEGAVDERLDKWEENDKAKRAKIEPFPTMSMTMQFEYPDKPKNNMEIDYYYKNYDCAAVYKMQNGNNGMDRSIMNFKEGTSTMLMTDKKGRKTGMVMELKTFDWAVKGAVEKNDKMLENGEATFTATDEYKTIEGYKCRKYVYEDQNNKTDMWMCNSVGMDHIQYNRAAYSVFANARIPNSNAYYKAGMSGVVIQMHIYPKGRGEEAIITMKNIKQGSAPDEMFSTAGYEVTRMPSMKDIWKSAKEND